MSLDQLEKRIESELAYIDFPLRSWMPPPTADGAYDVVIIGAGQSGLAIAHGLMREHVRNILVLDRAKEGSEGVWPNFARMHTLRTHKKASGLDFGNPLLTPQAWYTARYGESAWEQLQKIPTEAWHAYLQWYRRVLKLPVRNGAEVLRIVPDGAHLRLALAGGGTLLTRKVVLATGLVGGGSWHLPEITKGLPSDCYAHTENEIDFQRLAGARIGVLGGGASAFDNAATALEHAARSVDLCIRLPALPRVNPNKWMESHGFLGHYYALSDSARWAFTRQVASMNQPPPQETLWRCTNHANFHLHTGSAWLSVERRPEGMHVRTPQGTMIFDFLIFGTGLTQDLHKRRELTGLAADIATWADRYVPVAGEEDDALARSPYLGAHYQFMERHPGSAPYLRNIHAFNFGATLSQGLSAASISGMKFGLRRLVNGLVGDLFMQDADWHLQSLRTYALPEIESYRPGLPIDEWEQSGVPTFS